MDHFDAAGRLVQGEGPTVIQRSALQPGAVPPGRAQAGIVRPGRNAWRVVRADRMAFLVDGACYFDRLDQCLRQARRSVWIVGWDFNADILLRPQDGAEAEPLGRILRARVEQTETLEVRVLIWAI